MFPSFADVNFQSCKENMVKLFEQKKASDFSGFMAGWLRRNNSVAPSDPTSFLLHKRLLRHHTSVAKAWLATGTFGGIYCVPRNCCLTALAKSSTNFDNWAPASDPWMTPYSPWQLHCRGENKLGCWAVCKQRCAFIGVGYQSWPSGVSLLGGNHRHCSSKTATAAVSKMLRVQLRAQEIRHNVTITTSSQISKKSGLETKKADLKQ